MFSKCFQVAQEFQLVLKKLKHFLTSMEKLDERLKNKASDL